MKKILLLLVLVLSFSCIEDNNIDYTEENEIDIEAYIQENNLTFQKTASGLYYNIYKEGNGANPTINSNVTLGYKGYFLNGNIFDESTNATFKVNQVVPGFSEALRLLKSGGNGTFILPSRLGYGSGGSGQIKGGDVILFDINLIRFN